jgi:hypothetical protein
VKVLRDFDVELFNAIWFSSWFIGEGIILGCNHKIETWLIMVDYFLVIITEDETDTDMGSESSMRGSEECSQWSESKGCLANDEMDEGYDKMDDQDDGYDSDTTEVFDDVVAGEGQGREMAA